MSPVYPNVLSQNTYFTPMLLFLFIFRNTTSFCSKNVNHESGSHEFEQDLNYKRSVHQIARIGSNQTFTFD